MLGENAPGAVIWDHLAFIVRAAVWKDLCMSQMT
jgi:hypothetical protein